MRFGSLARLAASMVVFGVVLVVGGGVAVSPAASAAHASSVAVSAAPPAGARLPAGAVELTDQRTRRTRTYSLPDGTFTRVVSQGSLNYQDAQGVWQPIDNSLRTVSGGYENVANSYAAHVPSSLSAPVRFSEGGAWVSFSLVGASGTASVSGQTAKFANALPGVSVSYAAAADLLKESLVLSGPTAQKTFAFDLKMSPGLTPHADGQGGIGFVDAAAGPLTAVLAAHQVLLGATVAGGMAAVGGVAIAKGWRSC